MSPSVNRGPRWPSQHQQPLRLPAEPPILEDRHGTPVIEIGAPTDECNDANNNDDDDDDNDGPPGSHVIVFDI